MEEKKPWYTSKTIWINGIAAVGIVYQMVSGNVLASGEEQAAVLVVINLLLRAITKSGLSA